MARKETPELVERDVLVESRRRCCICFALEGDFSRKKGQIAHLDKDPSNSTIENLAFLCLVCHDEYDSRTSQSKGLTRAEVLRYRQDLYAAVLRYLVRSVEEEDSELLVSELEDPLAAEGEAQYYLAKYSECHDEAMLVLRRASKAVGDFNLRMEEARQDAEKILVAPAGLKKYDQYYSRRAGHLHTYSNELRESSRSFGVTTSEMLAWLTRALAVASDIEEVGPQLFAERLEEVRMLKDAISGTVVVVTGARQAVSEWSRAATVFNPDNA